MDPGDTSTLRVIILPYDFDEYNHYHHDETTTSTQYARRILEWLLCIINLELQRTHTNSDRPYDRPVAQSAVQARAAPPSLVPNDS